ncbi:TBC1 domain family member 14 [Sarcoptes scabiei]|uniref:TBC1 domain family member 14 n=1 Tax=Sarcoptes scabiei TaxID=52283 RepID=A0A834R3X8_SARSC|nr:TBC1 domain family member 14 [Sarcoptes scabiei]
MDADNGLSRQQIQHSNHQHCSLDNVLEQIDRNLVYDPRTKKLCLKHKVDFGQVETNRIDCYFDLNRLSPTQKNGSNEQKSVDETVDKNSIRSKSKETNQSKLEDLFVLPDEFDLLNEYYREASKPFVQIHSSLKRPDYLPPKNKDEERRHRKQFVEILQLARIKDLQREQSQKDAQRKKTLEELQIQKSIQLWNEILTDWSSMSKTKKVQDLWWNGIPSSIRPKIWSIVIRNDLNITEELYNICVKRSKETIWLQQYLRLSSSSPTRRSSNPSTDTSKIFPQKSLHRRALSQTFHLENSFKDVSDVNGKNLSECIADGYSEDDDENIAFLIKLDVLRTFPQLGLFQELGPYHQSLCDILSAYAVYRPDIGYSQGMSFLAAVLLLNSASTFDAFSSFANLLNNDLLIAFYTLNQTKMNMIYLYYDRQFKTLLPNLANHFESIGLSTDLFFLYQVLTLFARTLNLDCLSRVWDLFLRDGNEFLFRASLALLAMFQNELIRLEFIDSARFLTNLPEKIDSEKLFETIASIKLIPPKLSIKTSQELTTIDQNRALKNRLRLNEASFDKQSTNRSKLTFLVNKFLRL